MNLYLHLPTDIEHFSLLNEWFLLSLWKKDREIVDFFVSNFPWELWETISPQYEINFMAIRELKKRFWPNVFDKIDWIYYWSDNCEYLAPYKADIEKAINYFFEFNKKFPPHKTRDFVLVTPYVWDVMISKLEETLDYLDSLKIKNQIEIVVNDFWVLNLINKKYKNFKISFWRLIHKILKTPLIDTYWYDVHPAWELIKNKTVIEIEQMKKEIVKWQLKFYSSREVSLDLYRTFLDRNNISRIWIDFMEKRQDLYDIDAKNIWLDLYYPWALVFTWRLCDTSSIENPSRWFYAIDDICPRTCKRYDVFYKVKTIWYSLIQRWNSWYRSELSLDYVWDNFLKNSNNRLVFAPFIPV